MFIQPTQAYKTFLSNSENFRTSDKVRNDRVDASAGLAEKLGYSSQQLNRLKAFAECQLQTFDTMEYPDEHEYVYVEHDGMYIISPWVDDGGSAEKLTDVGALNCYGLEFLREWCRKADDAMQGR